MELVQGCICVALAVSALLAYVGKTRLPAMMELRHFNSSPKSCAIGPHTHGRSVPVVVLPKRLDNRDQAVFLVRREPAVS